MRAPTRRAALAALALAAAGAAFADGGRMRGARDAGPFRVSLFTRPEPLTAGPADVSVLVQDAATGATVLDAEVTFAFAHPEAAPAAASVLAARADRNRLFYSAPTILAAGETRVTARIRRGPAAAEASFVLAVAPAARVPAAWPWLVLPAAAVLVFAANQALRRHRGAALS